jgi:Uma2 family endonuclease
MPLVGLRARIVRDAHLPTRRRGIHHMAMLQSAPRWTVEMVRALPDDGKRYELIDGELLVTPSPSYSHQSAVAELFSRLRAFLAPRKLGVVKVAPLDVWLSPDEFVQPDVFVLPAIEGRAPRSVEEAGRLLLVIEVRSSSTARADSVTKRLRYQRWRIPEYWIVDVDARCIERWRPDDERPEMLVDRITWRPEGASEEMVIEVAEFFEAMEGF